MDSNTLTKPIVLITGSSGLIGQRISKTLTANYRVVGLDLKLPEREIAGVTTIECDFTKEPSVEDALAKVRQEYGDHLASVVHLAAYYDFAGEPSPLYDELTVEGTRRLLKQLHHFTRVEQFIFSSSLLVMKPCDVGEKLTEISPMEGVWDYPESKIKAEKAIRSEKGNIPAVILRIAGVYDEQGHSLPITQNIRRIAEKEFESYFFPGDADRGQAFIHLDDVVSAFEQAIEHRHDLDPLEVFLIAEDECLSYDQLQDIIGEQLHGVDDWPTIRIPKFVAKAGAWAKDQMASSEENRPFIKPWMVDIADAHYPVDASLAAKRLDWHAKHKLSETLPVMLGNLQADPAGWYRENKLPLPDEKKLEAIST